METLTIEAFLHIKFLWFGLAMTSLLQGVTNQDIEIVPQVETTDGILRGTPERSRNNREYVSFKGVPYAEKPERFKLAPPVLKWDGFRNATKEASPCPQMYVGDGAAMGPFGNEDCLYLNVYTPHKNEDNYFPVMVWIHGGAFVSGSSNEYRPDYFMDEDVVLVTINYRLGALGFLYNEDESIPGNLGLKDQVVALKWVKENIKNFGGDEKNVTIFGESAGAVSVHLHTLSELSVRIFHRAIAQSGSALAPWGLNRNPKWHAQRFALALRCPPTPSSKMVECLSSLEAHKLVEAQLRTPMGPLSGFHWAPVVEVDRGIDESTAFLFAHPAELISDKNFTSPVPLLTGIVKNEGLSMVSSTILRDPELIYQMNTNWSNASPALLYYKDQMLHHPNQDIASEKIRDFYFKHLPIGAETRQALTDLISDRYTNYPTYASAKAHSEVAPSYAYLFTFYDALSMPNLLNSAHVHVDDIPYLFNLWGRKPLRNKREKTFSRNLVKLWTSFASTGTPGKLWGTAQSWPPVNISDSLFTWYKLDSDTQLLRDPFHWRLKFWDHLLATDLKWVTG